MITSHGCPQRGCTPLGWDGLRRREQQRAHHCAEFGALPFCFVSNVPASWSCRQSQKFSRRLRVSATLVETGYTQADIQGDGR